MHIPDIQSKIGKVTFAGLIITLGIVFGDIGTSPLYVMKAIISVGSTDSNFIIGALSCIIWTLTLQTTVKYIIITLRADNKGEGGILALFALLRKKKKSVFIFAMIGAATLLADGVITPSITVISAVEGLHFINHGIRVIPIVLIILTILFLIQQIGTEFIGKFFGPIMLVWFSTIAILGFEQLVQVPEVLKAFNPVYAVKLLIEYPHGILILGAVFLCTTGAEALYTDLGHCGAKNIRISWIFVKLALILNYLGQGAWVINHGGSTANPFYAIMPNWFLIPGVIIATAAAIIASQALISGSFSIISEAITLNLWPKVKIKHPARLKGQLYVPSANWLLFFLCSFVVIFFQSSSNMEAAYGLSITLTMLMTTLLLFSYLQIKRVKTWIIWIFFIVYMIIENTFLIANLHKFNNGGWFTLLLAGIIFFIMFTWNRARSTKKRFTEFLKIAEYSEIIKDIQSDNTIPKYCSNLVYITRADLPNEVERKIIYSILNKQPKRADRYWFIHINVTDEPYTKEYKIHYLIPDVLHRIDFNLGFKINPRINRFFYHVISDMVKRGEVEIESNYKSLRAHHISGDFKFIIIDRIMTVDTVLTAYDRFIMNSYEVIKRFSITSVKSFGLDTSNVVIEKVPLDINLSAEPDLKRI